MKRYAALTAIAMASLVPLHAQESSNAQEISGIIVNLRIDDDSLAEWALDSVSVDLSNSSKINRKVFVPEQKTFLSKGVTSFATRIVPGNFEKRTLELEYHISRDGKTQTFHRSLPGTKIAKNYTQTFEDRMTPYKCEGQPWQYCSPESAGYSTRKLEKLRKEIDSDFNTTSMVVAVGGKIIFTYGDIEEPVRIASCRKSLMSMLYGKYVGDGTIDLDATLQQLGIDDIGGLLPLEKQATLRNCITARSGVYHPAANDGDDRKFAPTRGSVQPGTQYLYNNWDFNCLGGAFEMLTGKNIYDAFMEDIAIPVGLQDYRIELQHKSSITTPAESRFLAYHFWLSTRDMARIAQLMLQKGSWNGRRIISPEWIEESTRTFTPRAQMYPEKRLDKEFDYGYLWWIFCKEFKNYDPAVYGGGYTATGMGGQYITVLPALNMVIAHKDKTHKTGKSDYYRLIAKIAACRK